jgi:hypothetical protein
MCDTPAPRKTARRTMNGCRFLQASAFAPLMTFSVFLAFCWSWGASVGAFENSQKLEVQERSFFTDRIISNNFVC